MLTIPAYFVLNFYSVASGQGLFAQLWKEYAYSDSRYLTQDPFVLVVEAITVVGDNLSRVSWLHAHLTLGLLGPAVFTHSLYDLDLSSDAVWHTTHRRHSSPVRGGYVLCDMFR